MLVQTLKCIAFVSSKVTDADVGVNSEVDFSLDPSASNLFSLQSSGTLSAQLLISHLLDRETVDSYSFSIYATDRGSPPRTGSAAITINILVRLIVVTTHLKYVIFFHRMSMTTLQCFSAAAPSTIHLWKIPLLGPLWEVLKQ